MKVFFTPLIIVTYLVCLSCASTEYRVDGSGLDWGNSPIQTLPSDRVTPIVGVNLPDQLGGGTAKLPIVIPNK